MNNQEIQDALKNTQERMEIQDKLSDEQRFVLDRWIAGNGIDRVRFSETPITVTIIGKSYFRGVCFGDIAISFVKIKELKNEYETERDAGLISFMKEKIKEVEDEK